ncbi:hypothetical protein IFM89_008876 [Coptis chinensis]|uniref:F-box domain-containing protein n=1 Tax=Coptis chinensis TaxID=261450 RepID=A0A835HPH6_9MAGN|nr:hypothetical protein IFM89_008876 [Coptis chinensis]
MSDFFPLEIVENILLRSPEKTVARFRCVSKSWDTLISDPIFINKHVEYRLLIRSTRIYTLDYEVHKDAVINPPFQTSEYHHIDILGACNGLLCIALNFDILYIWNPSTGEYRCLRKPLLPYTSSYIQGTGLGYIATSDDYELVHFVSNEVKVYSLRKESWERTIRGVGYNITKEATSGIFVQGALHWKTIQSIEENHHLKVVIAYDMVDKKFREVSQPHYDAGYYHTLVSVLDGFLCMFCRYEHHTVAWVMKDYGMKESWTKLYSVEEPRKFSPLHLPEKLGSYIIHEPHGDLLVLYNPTDRSLQTFAIKDCIPKCLFKKIKRV